MVMANSDGISGDQTPVTPLVETDLKTWRVLIVDDEPDNLTVAALVLRHGGAKVRTANGATEAVRLIGEEIPNVILMDIQMPGMDGYATLKMLRQNPHIQDVPVVALTANVMREDRERISAAGFDGFIPKPFEIAQLVIMMIESLERHRDHFAARADQLTLEAAAKREADRATQEVPQVIHTQSEEPAVDPIAPVIASGVDSPVESNVESNVETVVQINGDPRADRVDPIDDKPAPAGV